MTWRRNRNAFFILRVHSTVLLAFPFSPNLLVSEHCNFFVLFFGDGYAMSTCSTRWLGHCGLFRRKRAEREKSGNKNERSKESGGRHKMHMSIKATPGPCAEKVLLPFFMPRICIRTLSACARQNKASRDPLVCTCTRCNHNSKKLRRKLLLFHKNYWDVFDFLFGR